jgi:hypothetical protein
MGCNLHLWHLDSSPVTCRTSAQRQCVYDYPYIVGGLSREVHEKYNEWGALVICPTTSISEPALNHARMSDTHF